MDNNKLSEQKHIDALQTEKVNWYNLAGGFSGKKINYYDCDIECPKSINFSIWIVLLVN